MPSKRLKLDTIEEVLVLLIHHLPPFESIDLSHPGLVEDLLGGEVGRGDEGAVAAGLLADLKREDTIASFQSAYDK